MIKKTITYTDFNGVETTDDFYFHLTKSEITMMELSAEGNSLGEYLKRIAKAQNGRAIIDTMQQIVDKSYGVRSPDGRLFEKNERELALFKSSGAYDELIFELLTTPDASADFVRGIVPDNLAELIPDNDSLQKEAASVIPQNVRRPMDHQSKHAPGPEQGYRPVEQVPYTESQS